MLADEMQFLDSKILLEKVFKVYVKQITLDKKLNKLLNDKEFSDSCSNEEKKLFDDLMEATGLVKK